MSQDAAAQRPIELAAVAQALARENRFEEATDIIVQALARAPRHRAVLAAAAAIADRAGDTGAALQHFAALRAAHPAAALGYVGALRCLRRMRRLDLAGPILQAGLGQEQVAQDRHFVLLAAQIASAGRKFEAADALWQRAAALWPDHAGHALSAALAPMAQRRGRAARVPEVLARLAAHHARFPDHAPAYIAHINSLREQPYTADAARLAAEWCARFPQHLPLAAAWAGMHEDAGDFAQALTIARQFHTQNAGAASAAMLIRALCGAGAADEAASVCADARAAYPADRGILLEYARLASRQGDWNACVARLAEACALLPDDNVLAHKLEIARLQLAEPTAPHPHRAITNLFDHFESLGGSGMGCEFGMVQGRFGSTSVGLLRWARTNPAEMIAAITTSFEGVGDPAFTIVKAARAAAGHEEYVTGDTRFLMESHSFVRTSDAPADRMFEQTCRRLRFLREKLIEDLRAAEKILVYRCEHAIDDALVLAMHAALAAFGDNALLCVTRAPQGVAGGTVRRLNRGIYAGYVKHFALDQEGAGAGPDLDGWQAVCQTANDLWRSEQGGGCVAI